MPSYILRGIAIGEMTRVIRNTTSPTICKKYSRKLPKHPMCRGCNKHILKTILKMKHASSGTMLRPNTKKLLNRRPTPLYSQFLKCSPTMREILTNRWKITYNDFGLLTLFSDSPAPVFTSRPQCSLVGLC